MREIIPTVVPSKAQDVIEARARYTFAPLLHIDCADGTLAPNHTWLPAEHEVALQGFSFEVHMMVRNPFEMGVLFARNGARRIVVHAEAFMDDKDAREACAAWRMHGVQEIGCALSLETPLAMADVLTSYFDFLQLMTIQTIGKQGEPFDARSIAYVNILRARYPTLLLAVDGGITLDTVSELARAGAERFCVGSALARAEDPASTYEKLVQAVNAVS